MKNLIIAICITFVGMFAILESAEAARFGGGRSSGMQRSVTPRQATPPAKTATQPAGQPGRSGIMGPIAGVAAALGLAALASYLGLGAEFANILLLALIVIVIMAVFRFVTRRTSSNDSMRYAAAGGQGPQPASSANKVDFSSAGGSGSGSASAVDVPAGFDSEAFLRVAKANFIRLQAANDDGNLDDIREFTSPEMFAEISLQVGERNGEKQHTEVVTLDAQLVELVTEKNRHVASVRFSGMIREAQNVGAEPFEEIWHLTKPVDDSQGWVVAGIQQS